MTCWAEVVKPFDKRSQSWSCSRSHCQLVTETVGLLTMGPQHCHRLSPRPLGLSPGVDTASRGRGVDGCTKAQRGSLRDSIAVTGHEDQWCTGWSLFTKTRTGQETKALTSTVNCKLDCWVFSFCAMRRLYSVKKYFVVMTSDLGLSFLKSFDLQAGCPRPYWCWFSLSFVSLPDSTLGLTAVSWAVTPPVALPGWLPQPPD